MAAEANKESAEASAPEKIITPAMSLAGVEAFKKWDGNGEEVEILVAAIFYSMLEAKREVQARSV
jgi:hypothetical protein